MAVINVDDIYTLDNTGKQVDDAVDYALANSNRNLLDNPWWGSGEVVNQRQITAKPSSNGAYCIDRWTWSSGADANKMSLGANGITFTRSASNIWFAQKLANPYALVGKKITGSVMLSDGTIKSGSVVYASVGSTPTLYQDSAVQIYISSVGAFTLTIKTTQTIRAVKLELGSYSTLINDTPPDYGEELRKCQRYFQRLHAASSTAAPLGLTEYASTSLVRCTVILPVPLRANPTVTLSGNVSVSRKTGWAANISTFTFLIMADNRVTLNAKVSGLAEASDYFVYLGNNAYLDLSADL